MKTPIYVIVLLAFILSSCSKETLDNDIINNDITKIDIGQEDPSSRQFVQSKDVEGSCFSAPLISSDYAEVGSIYFTVLKDDLKVTFQSNKGWEISESYMSISNCASKDFPVDAEGNVMMDQFSYMASSTTNPTESSHLIEKEITGAYFCFAAFANFRDAKGNVLEVWAIDWQTYIKTYIGECGVWSDDEDTDRECVDSDDYSFFIPLKPETSGLFPEAGSNSDTVTLTDDEPTSQGYLDIALNFTDVPKDFKNASLSIDFYDLDLYMDTYSSNGKVLTFSETFTLRDKNDNVLAVLDGTHSEDGEFTWNLDLPDHIFTGDSNVTLHVTFTANLDLIEGNSMQVSNTYEEIFQVRICGDVVPEESVQ